MNHTESNNTQFTQTWHWAMLALPQRASVVWYRFRDKNIDPSLCRRALHDMDRVPILNEYQEMHMARLRRFLGSVAASSSSSFLSLSPVHESSS